MPSNGPPKHFRADVTFDCAESDLRESCVVKNIFGGRFQFFDQPGVCGNEFSTSLIEAMADLFVLITNY
jgi:hypothetical protein